MIATVECPNQASAAILTTRCVPFGLETEIMDIDESGSVFVDITFQPESKEKVFSVLTESNMAHCLRAVVDKASVR